MSRILGIGTDLLSLSRFQGLCERVSFERVAARILSPTERLDYKTRFSPASHQETRENVSQKVQYLGSRWAVKEAVYKALSIHSLPGLSWKTVSLVKDPKHKRRPILRLDLPSFDAQHIVSHVTLSHDDDRVLAWVLFERVSGP